MNKSLSKQIEQKFTALRRREKNMRMSQSKFEQSIKALEARADAMNKFQSKFEQKLVAFGLREEAMKKSQLKLDQKIYAIKALTNAMNKSQSVVADLERQVGKRALQKRCCTVELRGFKDIDYNQKVNYADSHRIQGHQTYRSRDGTFWNYYSPHCRCVANSCWVLGRTDSETSKMVGDIEARSKACGFVWSLGDAGASPLNPTGAVGANSYSALPGFSSRAALRLS